MTDALISEGSGVRRGCCSDESRGSLGALSFSMIVLHEMIPRVYTLDDADAIFVISMEQLKVLHYTPKLDNSSPSEVE